jgi:membrane protease YdiL (CAAX protease family)
MMMSELETTAQVAPRPIGQLVQHGIIRIMRSAPILMLFSFAILFVAFAIPDFYPSAWGHYDGSELYSNIFLVASSFLLCFVFPALIAKFLFKEKLATLGLIFPQQKIVASMLTVLALLILLPCIYWLTKQHEFQTFYSLKDPRYAVIAFMNVVLFPIYYFAEEFFYRGFLFLGLWKRVRWHSFWVTDLFFAFAHLGKPGLEILLSMFASVIFNVLTLSTRSILPAFITHFIMGITMLGVVNLR